jgi:indolepyruvate ferredoxin oxidoreductase, alpha subunit
MKTATIIDSQTPRLLMGNEAMARGFIEAGVSLAASYPGTPASEIISPLF